MTHIETKALPDCLRSALRSVDFNGRDIKVTAKETYYAASFASQGQRGFTLAVNLATGETDLRLGSWGGSNVFVSNAVDSDTEARPIPAGFAIIQGTQGHPATHASILLHPSNVAAMLPAKADLTDRQRYLLACYDGLTSAGRKNEFERKGKPTDDEINELAVLGMVKINKAGAVSITTFGKNNRGRL